MKHLVFGVAVVALAAPALAEQTSLPVHRVNVSCQFALDGQGNVLDQSTIHEEIAAAVVGLADFAREHEGQAVYIEIAIEASDSSRYCEMYDDHIQEELPESVSFDDIDRWYGIRNLSTQNAGPETFNLWARTLETNAGLTHLVLPMLSDIPVDGLFVTQRFSHFYYYRGPSTVRYLTGNGFDAVEIYPIGNSQFFWKEISEIE